MNRYDFIKPYETLTPFGGERPLYGLKHKDLINIHIVDGESAIKECEHIRVSGSVFSGKYPLWHTKTVCINDCNFEIDSRAAVWYVHNFNMGRSIVESPKIFRESSKLNIFESKIDSSEAFWDCQEIRIDNSQLKGDYLCLHSNDIIINNVEYEGNYSFQHSKCVKISQSHLLTKDAFWNAENVEVDNSVIEGQYLAWYARNIKMTNCTIIGTQPFCYVENLELINCRMIETDLAFEYSTVNCDVVSEIDSIKNPISGVIKVQGIGEVIYDSNRVSKDNTKILIK